MPVVLAPKSWRAWLGEEPADLPQLKALLAPYPSAEMTAWPVSPRVGNVKNNDPGLIEPIGLL
jgi:putative SOS response-associated peptidase YedK